MKTASLNDRSAFFNALFANLSDFLETQQSGLVRLCYQKGASRDEIAKAIGIAPTNVSKHFPQPINEINERLGGK